jgi:peptidoglycan/xylan/chitin deacetylase (PgdA/CDA1 family)
MNDRLSEIEEDSGGDSPEVYRHLYHLAQQDYRQKKKRAFFMGSARLVLLLLFTAGVFFTLFYFFFLRDQIKRLNRELAGYSKTMNELTVEIETLSESERMYRQQISEYESFLSNVEIEDNRIVDFNLTESVRENLRKMDSETLPYKNIRRGNRHFRETALTFDLGTGRELPYVYSVLKRFNARATIFLSNEMAASDYGSLFNEKNIYYLKKLAGIGCEFGNHTWSHYNLKRSLYETSSRRRLSLDSVSDEVLDDMALRLEFDRVKNRVYETTGIVLSPYWRAPYGAIDHRILSAAARAGYPNHVFWSGNALGALDFLDYVYKRTVIVFNSGDKKYRRVKNPDYFTSEEMLLHMKEWEKIDPNGLNGAISIAHLGTARTVDKILKILPEYISYFQSRGYRFVTVSEVMNDRKDY